MIICVSYIYLDIICIFTEYTTNATGFIQASIKCIIIFQVTLTWTQPRECFITEWVNYFNFMIIGICNKYNILFRYEMYS